MAFTYEQILMLENPYEELGQANTFAENLKVLDALNPKEKNNLASKIVLGCPDTKLQHLSRQIEALRQPTHNGETFYTVLSEACQLKQRIFGLLDHRNPKPQNLLLRPEFNPALFHSFGELAKQLVKNNESSIAERLALNAAKEEHSIIARNIEMIFPQHLLAKKIRVAFTLRRNIDNLLLGNQPELFFSSPDFDKDICTTFANLLRILLKDHETEIGLKLAAITSAPIRTEVMHQLELLNTETFNQLNPFRLIASTMIANENTLLAPQATNINALFSPSVTQSPAKQIMEDRGEKKNSLPPVLFDSDEESDGEEDVYTLCGRSGALY